jgi:hypothetical protein
MALAGGSGGRGRGAAARGATEEERRSVPFVACGDLSGYDVDGDVEEGSSGQGWARALGCGERESAARCET